MALSVNTETFNQRRASALPAWPTKNKQQIAHATPRHIVRVGTRPLPLTTRAVPHPTRITCPSTDHKGLFLVGKVLNDDLLRNAFLNGEWGAILLDALGARGERVLAALESPEELLTELDAVAVWSIEAVSLLLQLAPDGKMAGVPVDGPEVVGEEWNEIRVVNAIHDQTARLSLHALDVTSRLPPAVIANRQQAAAYLELRRQMDNPNRSSVCDIPPAVDPANVRDCLWLTDCVTV